MQSQGCSRCLIFAEPHRFFVGASQAKLTVWAVHVAAELMASSSTMTFLLR